MATPFPFTLGQTLTAAQMNAITTLPSTTKVASHTLVIADQGTRVIMNVATANTVTVNTSIFGASDVVEIQNIGAGVCTVTAGTCTVSSAGPLAIPQNGGGRLVFSSASAATYFPTAVTASASGVVQVKGGILATTASTSSSTYVDTGITVTITPTSASNKVLVFAMVCLGISSGNLNTNMALLRDSTNLIVPTSPSNRRASINMTTGNLSANIVDNMFTIPITFLDSPNTTSATVYKVQFSISSGTAVINRTSTDTDNSSYARGVSTITVMEVTP